MTKKEIIKNLKELGVKFNGKATKEELENILATATTQNKEEEEMKNEITTVAEELVNAATVTEETATEETAAEETKKATKVKYTNYTSKKNLLKDFPNMQTETNQAKVFKNGFTYSLSEDNRYLAVTYFFSKGYIYKYAMVVLDDDMQAASVTYYDTIKEVKAAIREEYNTVDITTDEAPAEEAEENVIADNEVAA